MGHEKVKVVFFTRKQRGLGNFSVESYFENIRKNLPERFESVNVIMPFESNGLFKRLCNAIYCINKQGDINHITGDIHYVASFLSKRKTILTILDCGMLHQTTGLKHKILKWFWFDIPIKKASIITAISEATKKDIINFIGKIDNKIKVIYVCINDIFQQKNKVFDQGCPQILQIGTAPNKNLVRLIPALKNIPCKLVIVGKIGEDILQLLAENALKYELIDWRLTDQEIVYKYEESDVVSFVSTLEGFGMPIVEANAIGRVVVAGNNSSMPEIGSNAAHFVDACNESSITAGFKSVIQDSNYREQLINNGFRNKVRFEIKNLANQYAKLYDSLINES